MAAGPGTGSGPGRTDAPAPPGAVKRWVLGARPRTLPAAVVPVLVGTAAAHPRFSSAILTGVPSSRAASVSVVHGPRHLPMPSGAWWLAAGALVVALALQVGTNYSNDYSDGIRGTDDARVGPLRLVASGLASAAAVKRAALASFAVAGLVGLMLAWATSWWLLLVGAACLAAGWFYTGGPRPYGYAGFGELFVFVFFGLVATEGTYYVQTEHLGGGAVLAGAVAVGLLATALLLANNLRDIETDRQAGKRTLAARVGRQPAGMVYVACVVLPFVVVLLWGVLALTGVVQPGGPGARTGHTGWVRDALVLLPLLVFPLAVNPIATVTGGAEGRALLPVLAATGRMQLLFGALLAVGIWQWN